jgi:hypothetical protein
MSGKTKHIIENITIDTSFIEGQNFLAGSKMQDLSKLAREGLVKLYLTDIIYKEVIGRFYKNANLAVDKIRKQIPQLTSTARLLRNFPDYKMYFDLPLPEIDNLCSKFKLEFDKWIKRNRVTIIPSDHLTIKDVFDKYFSLKPPFSEGDKKHEFPDAFSLQAIEEFFKSKRTQTNILSLDKDILTYISDFIIPHEDSAPIIDTIIRSSSEIIEGKAIRLIELEFVNSRLKLEQEVGDLIGEIIEDEMSSIYEIDEIVVDSVEGIDIYDVELGKYSIVNLDKKSGKVKIECDVNFSFLVTFSGEDRSDSWYDKIDDKWYFLETKTYTIEDRYEITITINASFNILDEYADLEVDLINFGNKLNVIESFKPWKQ